MNGARPKLDLSVPWPDPHVAKLDNSHSVECIVDPFGLKLSTLALKRWKVGAENGSATNSKSGPEPYGGRHCKTWSEKIGYR
jgi:hypothetical protein